MSHTVITRKNANYSIFRYTDAFTVIVDSPICDVASETFESESDIGPFVTKTEKLIEVVQAMKEFETEMEGYSYYGSNPGIPQDSYVCAANAVIKVMETGYVD